MLTLNKNTQVTRYINRIYEIFWIFFLGGVLGFLIETIWCLFHFGELSSRTSNLFFPFSLVWALGALMLLIFFHFTKSEQTLSLFLKGACFCGIFEFACGYVSECLFGVTFWDYTELPLHIGRYVNLFICLLWGALCIVWKYRLYPSWNSTIKRFLHRKKAKSITVCMICFMMVTNYISGMALLRMNARNMQIAATSRLEVLLDTYFPDSVLQKYFPKMKHLNGEKVYSFTEMVKKR